MADCRDELTGINNRILTAQAKIEKLRSSSTKATKVFSSPKYPAPDKIADYHSIYQNFNPALHKVHIFSYSHIVLYKLRKLTISLMSQTLLSARIRQWSNSVIGG